MITLFCNFQVSQCNKETQTSKNKEEEEEIKERMQEEGSAKKWRGFWWAHIFKPHTYICVHKEYTYVWAYAGGTQKESDTHFLDFEKSAARTNMEW